MKNYKHRVLKKYNADFEEELLTKLLAVYLFISIFIYAFSIFIFLRMRNIPPTNDLLFRSIPITVSVISILLLIFWKHAKYKIHTIAKIVFIINILTELIIQITNKTNYMYNFIAYIIMITVFGILFIIFVKDSRALVFLGLLFFVYGIAVFYFYPDIIFTYNMNIKEYKNFTLSALFTIVPTITILFILVKLVFKTLINNIQGANNELKYFAFYDTDTNLPNLHKLESDLQGYPYTEKNVSIISLACIELNGLQQLHSNDGTERISEILNSLAHGIHNIIENSSTISTFSNPICFESTYRIDKESLAFIITNTKNNNTDDLYNFLEQLRVQIVKKILSNIPVETKFYFSVWPNDCENPTDLIHNIHYQLLNSNLNSTSTFKPFNSTQYNEFLEKLNIKKLILQAFNNNEFSIHFQPKLDFTNNSIHGLEALTRWESTEVGNVSPAIFIPIIEESGLIERLTDIVIEESLIFLQTIENSGIEKQRISINMSPGLLTDDYLSKIITRLSKEHFSHYLEFEITEGSLLYLTKSIESKINEIRELGVWFSIDDFGTGYSNLAYLMFFKADILKIDKRYIDDLPNNLQNVKLLEIILKMAKSFGMKTVAEGVETKSQADFLRSAGCDYAQGYYFYKPSNSKNILEILKKN
ncbi:MAG: EAL domain-containing protein [Spirochaetales bacterium]|nr:EAL domain-containing protein [Spirochaetales bacterium]